MIKHFRDYFYVCSFDQAKLLKGMPGWNMNKKGELVIPSNLLPFLTDDRFLLNDNFPLNIFSRWPLRNYQEEGRKFLLERRGALLADAPRLGKTAQIVCAHNINNGQLLVVGPLMTRGVWLTWFKRMWPTVEPVIIKGRKADFSVLKNAQIAFVNYDVIANWQNLICPPHTVVFDEAHVLSNRKTRRYQAALLLATQAKKVICATGTPLWNKPADLHSVVNLVEPGGWGTYWAFAQRYANAKRGDFGLVTDGSSHEDELRLRLSAIMLRRTWEDVRDNLAPIDRSIELVELDGKERVQFEYNLAECGGLKNAIGDTARLRRLFAQFQKASTAIELAYRHIESQESVVIWCWHRNVAEELYTRCLGMGWNTELITGETRDRDEKLVNWRSYDPGVLIMSLAVGQTGIDLSHARHAVFAEIDYTPAVMSQAEMRTFAPERPMTMEYVVSDHPIEMAIVKGLISKCRAAEKLGVPASDTELTFLEEIVSEEDFLLDGENEDSILSALFDEVDDYSLEE